MELLEELRGSYETATLVATAAAVLGTIFGVVAQVSRFCLRSAVMEWLPASPARRTTTFDLNGAKSSRVRSLQFVTAILVALVVTQALALSGIIDLSESIYHGASSNLATLIVGGLVFGAGMVLAGGCMARLTVLSATGNLRAVVTLIVAALVAYATLRGILAAPRIALEDAGANLAVPATLSDTFGVTALIATSGLAALLVAAVLRLAFRQGSAAGLFSGALIGLCIAAGWWVTGVVGLDDFDPTQLASLTFAAPSGDSLQYLMTYTGSEMKFGIAVLGGVVLGAFASALVTGRLALQGFEGPEQMLRYLAGGTLMGFGGITALGCTIGQGLTGISTLATGSFVALAAIVAGAALTQSLMALAVDRPSLTAGVQSTEPTVLAPAE